MGKYNVLKNGVLLKNILAFLGMVAVCGASLAGVLVVLEWLDGPGLERLLLPFVAVALYGAFGYFVFSGRPQLRAILVFFSVIACGALMVAFFDPLKTFYPLLTSLPFAAVAAATASATGRYAEKNKNDSASLSSN